MKCLVLVTGANGFIGSKLCMSLEEHGYAIRAVVREPSQAMGLSKAADVVAVGAMERKPTARGAVWRLYQ
jgi:uncharacterized protein YbjT (DUF2867 family)